MPEIALAGNDSEILIGSEAALTGGAVTATVTNGSALWYNVAGVASSQTRSLDLSASAFTARTYKSDNLLVADDGSQSGVNFSELQAVPSAIAFSRKLGKRVYGAAGLFGTHLVDITTSSQLRFMTASGEQASLLLNVTDYQSQYSASLGIAMLLPRNVRLGFALHGLYRGIVSNVQVSGSIEEPDANDGAAHGLFSEGLRDSRSLYGLQLGIGLQWDITNQWRFGFEGRSPGVILLASGEQATSAAFSSDAGRTYLADYSEVGDFSFKVAEPALGKVGLAYVFAHGQFAIEADGRSKASSRGVAIDKNATYNFRAGGIYNLSEKYHLGFGAFTDFAGDKDTEESSAHIDFMGLAGGVRYTNRRDLAPGQDAESLTFNTTLGVRYAHGRGHMNGARINAEGSGEEVLLPHRADARVHEVTANLASSLFF